MENHTPSLLSRPFSLAGIICTLALSLIGLLSFRNTDISWKGDTILSQKTEKQSAEAAYYAERFVTAKKEGTITHVSSVTPVADGSLACVWYQGSREGARDVSIFISFFDVNSSSWSEPTVLLDREQSSRELGRYVKKLGNPMIFSDSRGRLWLFYASVFTGGWSGASLNYKMSPDGGKSWGRSRKLILNPFFNLTNNVKNKAIELSDGSFLVPVYHEFIKKFSQLLHFIPDTDSAQYEIWKITAHDKMIQPSFIPERKTGLTAFFRNMGDEKEKHILTSTSGDLGQSWSYPKPTPLPNPNSGFDMIGLDDGSYLGVINDSFINRDNLTLVISPDRGKTWKPLRVLENKENSEYSYPSIVQDSRGIYHVTYTYERKRIKHVMFNEEWLRQTP